MFELLSVRGVLAAALIAPPSGELLAALDGIEVGLLDSGLQVDLMVAWERVLAWAAARQLPVVALVGDAAYTAAVDSMAGSQASMEMPFRAAHAEIGCALRLSERSGERRLAMARLIAVELPAVQTALLSGDISYRHAVAIAETAEELDDPADRTWVAATALPKARQQTVSELRRRLRRLLLAVQPKTAAKRHAEAVAKRKVEWRVSQDGMGELRLCASAADVKAVFNTIDAVARTLPKTTADGERSPIDARRADALVAMIVGTSGAVSTSGAVATTDSTGSIAAASVVRRPAASIQVTMDLATVLGLADNPAELAGYGPIPASAARALAADGKWRRLICDPVTGALIDLGTTVYRPNAELERYIRSRDARCSFPSCHQPAHRCEIDHTNPYRPGQPATGTDRCNLGCLCEYHHDLKHHSGWRLDRDPDDHTGTWTSTTGHRYRVGHYDHRSTDTMIRPSAITDDAELRWSDHVLTEINWDDFDWPDYDERHELWSAEMATAAATPAPAPAAARATVEAPAGNDQCPF
jgi:hypothetical protein